MTVLAVGTEPLLDLGEEITLARAIEAGVLARAARLDPAVGWRGDAESAELLLIETEGERARQRFIGANLRLVALVARSFASGAAGAADLFQEGCLGLIAAVERYDHCRGVTFSTYALYWIRASVGAAAARQVGVAELPTSRAEQLRSVRGHETELTQQLGRPVTVAELAQSLGRSTTWTAGVLAHRPPQSLDALDAVSRDLVATSSAFATPDLAWARRLLEVLTEDQRRVVELRHGFVEGRARSLAEVAGALQRSIGQIRRLERAALEQLRAACPRQAWDQL